MDLGRLKELEATIREAVQLRVRYLCLFEEDGATLLYGKVLNVGLDYCIFRLRPVKSGRHALIVKACTTNPKVFRETKAGWFAIDNIADHAVEILGVEAERRGEMSRTRQRLHSARDSVRYLNSAKKPDLELPMELTPNLQKPGKLDVTLRGLTEGQARRVLELVSFDLAPVGPVVELLEHLESDQL